ncbi:hypothetical protein K488DRAFT_73133 [Vararia minispora EC-137]|uniref:Uncharacterized protein n=1 Tax=Vararia minispora EC-137 TaxID=1314806 RepID=A0ACB8QBP9_9AGAM|nr:hypothetical protein K488DRAFT_73133 [Vararia minispora EC-137]
MPIVSVDNTTSHRERREYHKKTASKSSAFTAVSAPPLSTKKPPRSPSEPALPSAVPTVVPPLPPPPSTQLSPSRDHKRDREHGRAREQHRGRELHHNREHNHDHEHRERDQGREELAHDQDSAAIRASRVHAVVQEEVKPLREKLELLQAHVQTLKHKRSSRSSRHSKHAWASQDEPVHTSRSLLSLLTLTVVLGAGFSRGRDEIARPMTPERVRILREAFEVAGPYPASPANSTAHRRTLLPFSVLRATSSVLPARAASLPARTSRSSFPARLPASNERPTIPRSLASVRVERAQAEGRGRGMLYYLVLPPRYYF